MRSWLSVPGLAHCKPEGRILDQAGVQLFTGPVLTWQQRHGKPPQSLHISEKLHVRDQATTGWYTSMSANCTIWPFCMVITVACMPRHINFDSDEGRTMLGHRAPMRFHKIQKGGWVIGPVSLVAESLQDVAHFQVLTGAHHVVQWQLAGAFQLLALCPKASASVIPIYLSANCWLLCRSCHCWPRGALFSTWSWRIWTSAAWHAPMFLPPSPGTPMKKHAPPCPSLRTPTHSQTYSPLFRLFSCCCLFFPASSFLFCSSSPSLPPGFLLKPATAYQGVFGFVAILPVSPGIKLVWSADL